MINALDGETDSLKYVFITSKVSIVIDERLNMVTGTEALENVFINVIPSTSQKCERCWHYRLDVGSDAAHATLCGRCVSNLFGAGETRTVA